MIGFGISDHDSFTKATQNANGAIIGSEFIRAVSNYNTSLEKNIESFANKIKGIN